VTAPTAAAVAAAIRANRYRYANEERLQAGLAAALAAAGMDVQREVRLDVGARVDLAVGPPAGPWIGIEVKLAGSPVDVARQLQRYAHHPQIVELILVTICATHRELPAELGGKPVTVVQLGSVC
jgi:hypothetical protein